MFGSRANVEHDRPLNSQAEHWGSLFARIRYQSWLLGLAFLIVFVQGILLYKAAASPLVRVYAVHPNGEAVDMGLRGTDVTPSNQEVLFVAKKFAGLFYDYNSSKIAENMEAAANLCAPTLRQNVVQQTGQSQFISRIQQQGLRTEVEWQDVRVISHDEHQWSVFVKGTKHFFPIKVYTAEAIGHEVFRIVLVLDQVERDPIRRPNGLEIVRMVTPDPATLANIEQSEQRQ